MISVSSINVGMDIVLATVIAKTLRIYHIFKTFSTVSRACSDQGLFIPISSIVSVKIVMLIVLTLFIKLIKSCSPQQLYHHFF